MIRLSAAVSLAFAAAFAGAPALAQNYTPPPAPYYQSQPLPPPPGVDDRSMYRPRDRGAPYRDEDDEADALPPPGFAPPPNYYTQRPDAPQPGYYGQRPPQQAQPQDPNAMRPPGAVGAAPPAAAAPQPVPPSATAALPPEDQPEQGNPKELPPNLRKQLVEYPTNEPAGTIVIDTPHTYLYLVLGHGQAIRYGIGVGREGFTWAGTERISRMKEWPDWFPPAEMIERQPYLPRMMAGGEGNPLGARALYLGHTLYRIHGTNQPSTIGQTVSSGCIRLLNQDIEDLYSRVQVGTRVVVLPATAPGDQISSAGGPPGPHYSYGSVNAAGAPPQPMR